MHHDEALIPLSRRAGLIIATVLLALSGACVALVSVADECGLSGPNNAECQSRIREQRDAREKPVD